MMFQQKTSDVPKSNDELSKWWIKNQVIVQTIRATESGLQPLRRVPRWLTGHQLDPQSTTNRTTNHHQTAPQTTINRKPRHRMPNTITVSSFPFFHSHSRFGKHACQWLLIHVLSFVAGKYMMGSPFKNPSPFFISRTDPANVASLKWLTICIRKLASRCNDRGHRDSQTQVIMNKINQRCFPDSVLKINFIEVQICLPTMGSLGTSWQVKVQWPTARIYYIYLWINPL